MNREKLFKNPEKRYTSKRDMISRIPLGVNPDSLWQELLNLRRSSSTVLPLYSCNGKPYRYVTTEKMVASSEKIVDALFENETEHDPYAEPLPVMTLDEVFFTGYIEGAQITMQAAMDFLTGEQPPRDIEEQLIVNNRITALSSSESVRIPAHSRLGALKKPFIKSPPPESFGRRRSFIGFYKRLSPLPMMKISYAEASSRRKVISLFPVCSL